jgi:hypothetical protein
MSTDRPVKNTTKPRLWVVPVSAPATTDNTLTIAPKPASNPQVLMPPVTERIFKGRDSDCL